MIVKPGWQTTEFWLTIAAQIVALLVLFGFIGRAEQETIKDALSLAIQNVAALVASFLTIWKYIQSREEIKASVAMANATIEAQNDRQTSL